MPEGEVSRCPVSGCRFALKITFAIEKRYADIQNRINQIQRIYSRDMCCCPLFLEYFKLDEDVVRKYRNGEISIEFLFI
jgi:hypothetical protein